MTTVEALLKARQELQDAFAKDIQAIEHLLLRLGHKTNPEGYTQSTVRNLAPNARVVVPNPSAGSLRDWVQKAFVAHPSMSLSAPNIYEWAMNNGATFQADRDKSIQSLGNVLRSMTAEGILKLVVQGSGRRPSSYELNTAVPNQQEIPM